MCLQGFLLSIVFWMCLYMPLFYYNFYISLSVRSVILQNDLSRRFHISQYYYSLNRFINTLI